MNVQDCRLGKSIANLLGTFHSSRSCQCSSYEIEWAIERGPHFMIPRTNLILFFISIVVTLIPAATVLFFSVFFHMYYVLHRDNTHSKSAIEKIKKSLRILLIQLLVPFLMVTFPMTFIFISPLCECISNAVVLSVFGVTAFHPIVHNLILLGITPTYRAIIVTLLRKIRAGLWSWGRLSSFVFSMVYISEQAQYIREDFLHIIFCISAFLNLVSLFCLIKQTPPNQAKIRNFLLFMQIMVITIGIYTDFLMKPIPLFPAIAGICTGILCTIIPPPTVMGILILLYVWLAAAIGFCIFFRHQTLLSDNGKLSKSRFDLGWAVERGPHFIIARTNLILAFITVVVTFIPAAVALFLAVFFHMSYVLNRDNTHSKSAINKIRRSLRILLIQLMVPFVMVAFPMTFIFVSPLCECISNEVVLSVFGITAFHPIVHNLILLGITPTYRAIIVGALRKIRGRALGGVEPQANMSVVPSSMRDRRRLPKNRTNLKEFGTAQKSRFSETMLFGVLEDADDDGHSHFSYRRPVGSRWRDVENTVISIEFYLGSQTRLIFAFILTEEFWKNCFRRHAVWSQRDANGLIIKDINLNIIANKYARMLYNAINRTRGSSRHLVSFEVLIAIKFWPVGQTYEDIEYSGTEINAKNRFRRDVVWGQRGIERMPTIYLSEEAQYIRQIILHVLFCISTFLNFASLYCLINQTPPNQAKIRNFLLFVQIIVILIGIYTDLLMVPIPLMPAISGICTEIETENMGIQGCLLLLYVWLAAAIFFCIFFRHQTLLSGKRKLSKAVDSNLSKKEKKYTAKIAAWRQKLCYHHFSILADDWKSRMLIFSALFIPIAIAVTYSVWSFDSTQVDEIMFTSPFNLGWATLRGPHFIIARSSVILFFISTVVVLIPVAFVMFGCIFIHMYYVLHKDNTQSTSTICKIRRSLCILLIQRCSKGLVQLLVPFVMIAGPTTIMFLSMLCECIPFEVNISLFGVIACHPLVHNLILLGITPTYRARILALLRKLRGRVLHGAKPLVSVSAAPTSLRVRPFAYESDKSKGLAAVISIEFYLGSQTRLILAVILTEGIWKNCFRRHAIWSQRDGIEIFELCQLLSDSLANDLL
uniref:G protein-coupled receptor n=1 Tax=Pristionchus pacificus TaxID=54126 RepID=A0A8R1YGH7_PRIPA